MENFIKRTAERQLRQLHYLLTVLFLLCLGGTPVMAQDFTLNQSNITLKTGATATVEVTSTSDPLPVESVSVSPQVAERLTIQKKQGATPQSVVLTLTARQQTGNVELSVAVGSKALSLNVSIQPQFSPGDPLPFSPSLPDTLELKRNEIKPILVTPGSVLQSTDLKPRSTDDHVVLASFDGQQFTITAIDRGTAQVIIGNVDKVNLKTIAVTVKEAPENVRPSPLEITIDKDSTEADWYSLVSLVGRNSKDVTTELKADVTPVSENPLVVQVNPANNKLKGLKTGYTSLRFIAGDGTIIGPVLVHVSAKPTAVTFSSDTGSFIVRPNQTIRVTAILKNGDDITDDARVTKWDYANLASKSMISFADFGANTISVTALPGTNGGTATLKAYFNGISQDVDITIQTFVVTDFKPLQIRFDVLDEQMGRDLFGKKATDDFHISKIRLFNKLRDVSNLGNSILVYGESLEVNVALEIKRENGKWETLESPEYARYFGHTNPDPLPYLDPPNPPKPFPCNRTSQPNFIQRYRPLTFEMVANTHDRRDDRSMRSRILLGMNSASSLASFITAVAVPSSGSDLPLGLDKFRNLLIPSFEKLFPNMRELQRQNIVSMGMRQLEEVPFGSDITRVVFFPKKPIKGVIPGKAIRIAGISISDACAEVAIIKKAGQP